MYRIVDTKTGQQVGKNYKSRSRARAQADKLDNAYGAYRYIVRIVGAPVSPVEDVNNVAHTCHY